MAGSIAGNSARLLSAQVAGNAGYFAAVLLLARALSPAERGTIAFITVTALVTSRVANLGLSEATKVLVARRPGVRAALLSTTLIATGVGALGGAALICGGLALATGARPAGVGAPELALLGLGVAASAWLTAGFAFLQGCSRFGAYTRQLAVGPWLYALPLAAASATVGLSVGRAALVWVIAQGVRAGLVYRTAAREVGFGRPDRRLHAQLIRFGLRAWPGGLAELLNARVDQIIFGLVASATGLGLYAVAVNASEVLTYLPTAVAVALLPTVALGAAATRAAQTLRVFRILTLATLAQLLGAAAAEPVLLPLVFGDAYRGAVGAFLWLLPGALGFTASAVLSNALLASGAPTLSSVGPVVSLTLTAALDLLLIPRFGAAGAGAAASVAQLAGGVAAAVAYRAHTAIRWTALVPRRADLDALEQLGRRARTALPGARGPRQRPRSTWWAR